MTTGVNTEKFIEDIFDKPIIWDRNCPTNKAQVEAAWIEMSKKFVAPISQLKSKWKGLRDMFRVEIKRIPRNEADDFIIQPHEYESKWIHYRSLLFLADHMRSRKGPINSIQKNGSEVYDSYASYPTNFCENDANSHLPAVKQEAALDIPIEKFNKKRKETESAISIASPSSPAITIASMMKSPDIQYSVAKKRAIDPTTMEFISGNDTADISERIMNDDYHFLLSLQPFMSELNPIQKLRLRMKIQKLVFEELYANENPA